MKKVIIGILLMFATQVYAQNLAPVTYDHSGNVPFPITSTGTSSALIVANSKRTGLACGNTGSATAFIAYGQTAVSGSGIPIFAGSVWWMDRDRFSTQAINVIGVTTLSCQEFQ